MITMDVPVWFWLVVGTCLIIIYFLIQFIKKTNEAEKTSPSHHKEIQFNAGYLSPYMTTDEAQTETALANSYVLIVDQNITKVHDIIPVLELVLQRKRTLLVIVKDIEEEEEVLATLVVNKLQGSLQSVAVKTSTTDVHQNVLLSEIATLTSGQVITNKMNLRKVDISQLGSAKRVIVTSHTTKILTG